MFQGFFAVAYKEGVHIRRDPVTLFFMLVIPLFQLLVFGYAINTEVRNIKTAVYNLDRRQAGQDLMDSFHNTSYFKITRQVFSDQELNQLIVSGKVKIGIKIPPDYSDNLLNGRPAGVLVLVDGSDSSVASQAVAAATALGLKMSLQMIRGNPAFQLQRLPIDIRTKMLFNPDSRTANFMVPALVAIILQIGTSMLTALSLVRERERGTLEQLLVTPVKPLGLMLGKLAPYCLVGFFQACSILTIMRFVFRVPIHGSVFLLLGLILLFIFSALGIGLLISTRAANQVQAMQMTMMVTLPSVLLSGYMFPRESMPAIMFFVGFFIPATYLINIMRGIVLRGAGFFDLWPNVIALAVMGLFFLTVSARRFKKSIE